MAPVTVSRADGITTLALDAPERRNALSGPLVDALTAALREADEDPGTRAVVLTHTGGTFCAGADLKEPPDPAAVLGLLRLLPALGTPVVARVDGHARAGGIGLVGACDIAVAGPAATFAFTEVRIGVSPAVISLPLLPRLDPRAAGRYFLTGETFGAAEAVRMGLLTAAAHGAGDSDGQGDVDTVLAPVLDGLRRAAPGALRATKELLNAKVLESFAAQGDAMSALSARLFASAEAREGMTAFLERRDPSWAR
jgi:enoyl-CoA hydratase